VAKPTTTSYWRQHARRLIERTLEDRPDLLNAHPKAVRAALNEVYPFGRREHLPYKMWLREINLALYGPEPGKGARVPPPEQPSLFPEEEAPADA
jgi:hypothetical protein